MNEEHGCPDRNLETNVLDLDEIFGPAPRGGEIVLPPDNPSLEETFSSAQVEQIGAAARALSEREWKDIYKTIRNQIPAADLDVTSS